VRTLYWRNATTLNLRQRAPIRQLDHVTRKYIAARLYAKAA
jgi:hypothetical protein